MIRCRELPPLLVDFLADELPQQKAKSIRAHLEWCPNCSAEVERYQQMIRATRTLPDAPVPEPLLERLRAAVRDDPPPA